MMTSEVRRKVKHALFTEILAEGNLTLLERIAAFADRHEVTYESVVDILSRDTKSYESYGKTRVKGWTGTGEED